VQNVQDPKIDAQTHTGVYMHVVHIRKAGLKDQIKQELQIFIKTAERYAPDRDQ